MAVTSGTSKVAAVLAWVPAFGFGLPALYAIWYFLDHDEVWTFLGFTTYGDGPFETLGLETSVPLLVAFVLVCAAEAVLGWKLWRATPHSRLFAILLFPVELTFWLGFALPLGPVLGIARIAAVLVAGRPPPVS